MKTIKTILLVLVYAIIFFMPLVVLLLAPKEETDIRSLNESSIAEIEDIISQDESISMEISEEMSNEVSNEAPNEDIAVLEPISKQYAVVNSDVISELKSELDYCQGNLRLTKSVINYATLLGYEDTCEFLQILYQDCENYQYYIDYYEKRISELNDIKYTQGTNEYPAATYIWNYMKKQGWSDYVCAGILGNIMQETGGRTLNIDYMHSSNYYGMCCWNKEYHPEVVGLDLDGQCAYLIETTARAMEKYGYLYQEGYTFQDFLEAESIEEAAAAFMIVYERPGHTNPIKRVQNGEKAYEYFTT